MTQYTVYLTKEIPEPGTNELTRIFDFYKVSDAKKFIREHMDIYGSSCATKIYSNGGWEDLGPINLSGNNRHFLANTRMTKENY